MGLALVFQAGLQWQQAYLGLWCAFENWSVLVSELYPKDNVFFVGWCEVKEASYA